MAKPSTFKTKFDRQTQNQFEYIRLSSVEFFVYDKVAKYKLIYPESKKAEVEKSVDTIQSACKKILKSAIFDTDIVLVPSHFDTQIFLPQVFEILKSYPAISSGLQANQIRIARESDKFLVELSLEQNAYSYALEKNIVQIIKDKLYYMYTDDFEVKLNMYQLSAQQQQQGELRRTQDTSSQLELPKRREILARDIVKVFGSPIDCAAQYIVDSNTVPKSTVTLCGNLTQWEPSVSKSGKQYARFELVDPTGKIRGIYFQKQKDDLSTLAVGSTIIAKGKTALDDFKKDGSVTFQPTSISLCTIPDDFVYNRKIRSAPLVYTTVFPQVYSDATQQSIDDLLGSTVQPSDETIVVFDIETTGLDPKIDSIIDLGAAKIQNGLIVETFQTLIDPLRPIPPNSIEIHHITDQMVQGQPTIEPVLLDFLKFVQGCTIVAHNIDFDYSFISLNGQKYDIYFDNPRLDTVAMARKKYPKLHNHRLETLCKYLEIPNNTAHRALSDAIATAKLYLVMKA